MDIYGFILLFILWISPYWWVKKLRKEINDKILILGIILTILSFLFMSWIFSLIILFGGMHFLIAYLGKFGFRGCYNAINSKRAHISSGSHRKTENSWSHTDEYYVGSMTTYEQDEAMQKFSDYVESTQSWNRWDDVRDQYGNIDYNAVEKANEEMEAELPYGQND